MSNEIKFYMGESISESYWLPDNSSMDRNQNFKQQTKTFFKLLM